MTGDVASQNQMPVGAESIGTSERVHDASLLDLVFDAVFERDFTHDLIRSWNRSAEQLYGWSSDEAIGRSSHELLRTVHSRPLDEIRRLLVETGRWEGELVHATRHGRQIVVRSRWALYEDDGVTRILEVNTDITDQRRAEAERAQLAAIVRSTSDAIIGKTLDGTITSWNRGAERMYQFTPEEAIGQHISLIVPPELLDDLDDIMGRIHRGESIEHRETVRVRKDGTRIDVSLSISPIRNRAGAMMGAATIARDISDLKREEAERARLLESERELREKAEWAEQRLTFLAEASSILSSSLNYEATLSNVASLAVPYIADWCVINLVDADGNLNRLALAHADPERIEFAKRLEEEFPPDPDSSSGPLAVMRSGQSRLVPEVTDEMLVRGARNQQHLALLRSLGITSVMIVPLRVRDHAFGAISLVTDRSGRRYSEDDLDLAEDLATRASVAIDNARLFQEAQEALRLREEFLSIASHELKTPLTALQLQAQVLRRMSDSGESSAQSAERVLLGIERQVKRLARLTTDLLDVSRIAAGRFTLERTHVDLSVLVEAVAGRFGEELAAAGASIALHIQPGVTGQWDRHRLDQVISNLFSNAIKYGRGSAIDVELSGFEDGARLVVIDRGIGIEIGDLGRIFERFERIETAERAGGLGLGLFIVREIVEAHGGRVWAESEPGQTTRFVVQLPYS